MAIKKFQDLQVEYPQRYEVTDNAGTENLKTIKFSPGKVYQEGTKETAVIFNNIQKNGLYTVIGTRSVEGTEEIYDVELEGLEEFGMFDINLQLVANSKNTTNSPKLRILNEKYSFVNNNGTISVGDLTTNNIHVVKIDTVKKTAFLIGSDKLDKGTYLGTAGDLKTEIDGKVSKSGDTMTGVLNIKNDDKVKIALQSAAGEYQATFGFDKDTNTLQLWNEKTGQKFNFGGADGLKLPSNDFLNGENNVVAAINTNFNRNVGVIGKLTGTFPLTSAIKGNTYFLKSNSKVYICIEDYSGSSLTAPNANFEELSIYTNRTKLDNISVFEKIGDYTPGNIITLSKDFRTYKYMQIDITISTGIIASFVTTTSNKIGRQLQFSTAAGEASNAAIALNFNSTTTIQTSNIRNTTLITLYLFN